MVDERGTFQQGDRVRLSPLGRGRRRQKRPDQSGIVASRANAVVVAVVWDGYKSRQTYHRDYLEVVPAAPSIEPPSMREEANDG
jgi:hypothetical protein